MDICWGKELNSSFPRGITNKDDCKNKPAGEDNSVGNKLDEEITLWGRDALPRIPPINSAGDEFSVVISLGITF